MSTNCVLKTNELQCLYLSCKLVVRTEIVIFSHFKATIGILQRKSKQCLTFYNLLV